MSVEKRKAKDKTKPQSITLVVSFFLPKLVVNNHNNSNDVDDWIHFSLFPVPFLLAPETGEPEMTQHKKQPLWLFHKPENAGPVNRVLLEKTGLLP